MTRVISGEQAVPEATFALFPDDAARDSFAADLERAMSLRLQSKGVTVTRVWWETTTIPADPDDEDQTPTPVRVLRMEGTAP